MNESKREIGIFEEVEMYLHRRKMEENHCNLQKVN